MNKNSLMVHKIPFNMNNKDTAKQVLGYVPDGYIFCALLYDHAVIWVNGNAFLSFFVEFDK